MKKGSENIEFTGERFVPSVHGNIELEHLHRYLQACEIAVGKVVLDIASGEGYGSAMLADKADKVIGVDISVDAIKHARKRYKKENLEYMAGSCADIPLSDACVDMVVSFETIEHHDQHEQMMQEIKRVLRPTGILLISSPDKYHYSIEPGYSNPFHVKELYQHEFKQLLERHFKNAAYFGQRVIYGSGIFAESLTTPSLSYWQENELVKEASGLTKPIYWIALASDTQLPKLASGVLEQPINDSEIVQSWRGVIAERDGQIASLSQAVIERDGQIASLNQAVTERDGQIASLSQAVIERDGQIASLNHTLAEREDALIWSRMELTTILASTSWKLLSPIRQLIISWRILKARCRVLLMRSAFVIRQEGLLGYGRRTVRFVGRYWQRKLAARQIERFVAIAGPLVPDQDVPLVSFVIPIYDRTDVLRASIESALKQSLQVFEVILITDGSPPATLAVVEEFRSDPRVRIFNYPVSSGNAVRGRNKGILEARGKYIAFLDSDDVAAPDRLEVCLPILESGNADVVYGAWRAMLDGTREIDGLAHAQEVYSPDCDLAMLEKICVPCQSTVMVRREILQRRGYLKPRMQYREDHELWLRLAYHGAIFKSVPHVLTELRLHSGNNELNFKGNDTHWENMLREEYRHPGHVPKKIGFLLAGLGVSGGAAVVLKHVSMLMEAGHDAFVIDIGGYGDISWFGNPAIPVYRLEQVTRCGVENIDLLFATFWTTVAWLEKIPARRKLYLVQSDERLFYDASVKALVAKTYGESYEYVAIAQWLVDMLRKEFGKSAIHIPNGLDSELFYPDAPLLERHPQRLRVLIEGPISVPFKGVAEAYSAVSELDCEIWIVSADGKPEIGWRYDRFFEGVNQAEMRRIYSSCHVLLKMSRVESFAYPPLEAMACGCAVVLGEVNGGIEYACNEVNVLKVPQGDVAAARAAVLRLLTSPELRERLILAGFETVKRWSWESSRKSMLALIEAAGRP